jgi:glycosyltransferase involved in cell wall biosynthesis
LTNAERGARSAEQGRGAARSSWGDTSSGDSLFRVPRSALRIALVHDYLNQYGGAERVLEEVHALWPEAPVYTSIYDRERMPAAYRAWDIRTTFMQRLPGILRNHQPYLPVYPLAFSRLDLRGYDLVISSSSAFAKNVHPAPGALHICYCHSPMRFAWNYRNYARRERIGRAAGMLLWPVLRSVRLWDAAGTSRVDHLIANSRVVAERIRRFYGREATVVHPPVRTEGVAVATGAPDDFYLVVTRLVPYKRLDVVVEAFARTGRPLKVVGEGRDRAALERLAGPSVQFLGRVSDEEKNALYAHCRATIFPAEDDFGIAQVEAQAAGRPVLAYRAGGALETVVERASRAAPSTRRRSPPTPAPSTRRSSGGRLATSSDRRLKIPGRRCTLRRLRQLLQPVDQQP